ncbi:unnamed protein product [Ilex paraguariensis]|uniref:Cation-transporting P-type ATPase C-terminal domain-containing protein n=1 Tax=Ilex paraguariensis TaxID=185542 RepID=A0ABC8RVG9_9AQUA
MASNVYSDQILKNNSFDLPCPSPDSNDICNNSIENQINPTNHPIPIWNQLSVDISSFEISQESLAETKDVGFLDQQPGGVSALEADPENGISVDHETDLSLQYQATDHTRSFDHGTNPNLEEQPSTKTKGFFTLALEVFKKYTSIILLFCCATLSIVIDVKRNGAEGAVFDAVVTYLAILTVVFFGAIARVCKRNQRMIEKLSRIKLMRPTIKHFLLESSNEESKLQSSINTTYSRLEKICLSLSLLLLVAQVLRCFLLESGWCDENHNPDPKGVKNTVEEMMSEATKIIKKQERVRVNRLVSMLCILVFATRDGLPLGISISLAYASMKMMWSHRAMVRKLPACATMGLVTTICTGKTIDLALQHKKMADLWIGFNNIKEVSTEVASEVLDKLREGVSMNMIMTQTSPGEDAALLCWAQQVLGINMEESDRSCTILHTHAFDLSKNRRGLLLRRNGEVGGKALHVHWQVDPEMALSMCSEYYDVDGTMQTLDEDKMVVFKKIIETISSEGLQCFAFAYKQIIVQKKKESLKLEEEEEILKPVEYGLTLLAIVTLKNPYTPQVREAVKGCREAGVKIKLVVGDDLNTARIMAINSGILSPEEDIHGAIINASEFRSISEEERKSLIDNLRVMADTTSSSDKLLMVQCLRQNGEVVAVTGTCTRDAPSLVEADVGLFLGHIGAEEAEEDVDIAVLDMDFLTISALLKLGRGVCNNLEKFLQFQMTFNIVAFTLNLILEVCTSEMPITPFQLLWVNLIMDVLGALALATTSMAAEPPPSQIRLERPPPPVYGAGGSIFTQRMKRNIAVQSLFQVTLLLILHFKGKSILQVDETTLEALIFNSYMLCQVSVLINTREIDKTNGFEGMFKHKNCGFLVLVGAIVVLQLVEIELAAVVAHSARGWWKGEGGCGGWDREVVAKDIEGQMGRKGLYLYMVKECKIGILEWF